MQTAHRDIETLRPEISRQEALEKELADLRDKAAAARSAASRLAIVEDKLAKLREAFRANTEKIRLAEEQAKMGGDLKQLETRSSELMRHLAEMRAAGSRTVAQDEATSVVWGMPGEAVSIGAVEEIVPIDEMATCLCTLAEGMDLTKHAGAL